MANIPQERRNSGAAKENLPVRLLVVEDDLGVRRMICRALEGGSHSGRPFLLQEAVSIEEALPAVQRDDFDLVVLDLGFSGGLQGGDLLKRLREGGVDLPILVVTGNFMGLDHDSLFRLGAADVLHKPLHIYELRAAVIDILNAAAATRRTVWREAAARVLHVEDIDDWAVLVRLWLDQTGYASHRVGCRAELMRFLRSCRELPDCILLDLSLPDIDGLALCDELKGHPEYQAIPLVVCTARGDDRLAAMKRLAVQVVVKAGGTRKPVREELFAAVDATIDQAERTRGVYKKSGLRLDPKGHRVFAGQRCVAVVDPAKFSMLRLLLERSPSPVPEDELRLCLPRAGYRRSHPEDPNPNTVAVYVSALRRHVNLVPAIQILHQPGKGYVLLANVDGVPL